MPKDSIRLSEKYGLNPAIPLCFFCNKPKNVIILAGFRGGSDRPAPQNVVWDKEPCGECEKWMKEGIICISVRDGEKGGNPYRTGGWCVVKEEAMHQLISDEKLRTDVITRRVVFMEDDTWDKMGFPRENIPEENGTSE